MSNKNSNAGGKSPPFEFVAGNGLIDRRALLGRGVVFAGAMGAGGAGSLVGAAAETASRWAMEPRSRLRHPALSGAVAVREERRAHGG